MNKKWLIGIVLICLGSICCVASHPPVLQALIEIAPANAFQGKSDVLQPGMPALLKAVIKNIGGQSSAEGEVSIRFTLPKALASMNKGVMFETEKEVLPRVMPGELLEIVFKTPQQLPGLGDFLKNDWPMRLYEAVVRFGKEEFVIGSGTITFSAYYYPGPNKPLPTAVPAAGN